MKTILLPVEEQPSVEPTIDTAVLLAAVFGSYVEGFALTPDPPLLVSAAAFSGAMITTDPHPRSQDERVSACRTPFDGRTAARALARQPEPSDGASFGWPDTHAPTAHHLLPPHPPLFTTTAPP